MATSARAPRATRSPEESRGRILSAAQAAFGTHGYARSGVREIAEAASVAPSLVIHYFGSKQKLFEHAFAHSVRMSAALSVARSGFGANAVSLLSEDQTEAANAATMLAQSIADPSARAIAGTLLEQMVLEPVADWLPPPDARARAQLIAMLTLGFTVFRLLVSPEELNAQDDRYVATWMERTLQGLADGGDPD